MDILSVLAGLLVGLVIGGKLEARAWRKAAKTPHIRITSGKEYYNVCTENYYKVLTDWDYP